MKKSKQDIINIRNIVINLKDFLKPISNEDMNELILAGEKLKHNQEWNEEFNKDMEKEIELQSHEDIAGQTIKIGDYIIYGDIVTDDDAQLCFGKIVGFSSDNVYLKCIAVQHDLFYNKDNLLQFKWELMNNGKPTFVRLCSNNYLKVDFKLIPNNALQLLLCANADLKPE